ncbi:MAG: CHAP domain-containing protein [Acetobacteraceae bacterium]
MARFGRAGGGLQCVPFARENSGIELTGNAATWWAGAEGVYERGAKPEVGSVLNFRATGRMRMGHVAVVTNVINGRSVEIDHANWAGPGAMRGGVSRNITVVDVSPGNDWTAVRVALGHTDDYGSTYPTYGFIYDRPDRGTMVANAGVTPSAATVAPALASADAGPATEAEEVAEAADDTLPRGHYRAHRHSHFARAGFGRVSVLRIQSRSALAPRHHAHHHRT